MMKDFGFDNLLKSLTSTAKMTSTKAYFLVSCPIDEMSVIQSH